MPIQEEDEEEAYEEERANRSRSRDGREMDEESIEEVDQFSPIIRKPGETVEEIYEDGGGEGDAVGTNGPADKGKNVERVAV